MPTGTLAGANAIVAASVDRSRNDQRILWGELGVGSSESKKVTPTGWRRQRAAAQAELFGGRCQPGLAASSGARGATRAAPTSKIGVLTGYWLGWRGVCNELIVLPTKFHFLPTTEFIHSFFQ